MSCVLKQLKAGFYSTGKQGGPRYLSREEATLMFQLQLVDHLLMSNVECAAAIAKTCCAF